MDLNDLASLDTADFTATHPKTLKKVRGSDDKAWVWTIAGPAHPLTLAMKSEARQRAADASKASDGEISQELMRKLAIQNAARRVLGWTTQSSGGVDFPCTFDNVCDIFSDMKYDWLYRQALTFMADDASFMSGSASV